MTMKRLYEETHTRAVNYAAKVLGPGRARDAEDVVQNAFVELLQKGPEATEGLLFHMLRFRSLNTVHRERLVFVAEMIEQMNGSKPDQEFRADAARAGKILTPREFECWILKRCGLTTGKVAKALDITPRATKVLSNRANRRLKGVKVRGRSSQAKAARASCQTSGVGFQT